MEDYIDPRWRDAVEIGFSEKVAKKASKIVEYCENDVLVLSQVILRFKNDPLLQDEEVVFL